VHVLARGYCCSFVHICKLNIIFNTRISVDSFAGMSIIYMRLTRKRADVIPTILALIISCKSNARTATTAYNNSNIQQQQHRWQQQERKKGNQLCKGKKTRNDLVKRTRLLDTLCLVLGYVNIFYK